MATIKTTYALFPPLNTTSPHPKIDASPVLKKNTESDWPEPLKVTKRSSTTTKHQGMTHDLLLTPPSSPQFGLTSVNSVEERPVRRELGASRVAKRLSPSNQYMLNNIAPFPLEDDGNDEVATASERFPQFQRRARPSAQMPARKELPRDRAVTHQVDHLPNTKGLRQHPAYSQSLLDRRNMTDPTLRHHLQYLPLQSVPTSPRRSSNSSSNSSGNRTSSSSITGYRSRGTSATSPSSSVSSNSSFMARLPPNSAEKWIPVVQAQIQSSIPPALPHIIDPALRLPPNSAERWKYSVQAQLQQQQPTSYYPPATAPPSLRSTVQSATDTCYGINTVTLPIHSPVPAIANTSSIRKTSISVPISSSTTDVCKPSICSWSSSPPLLSSQEFTCPRRSPLPQEKKVLECVSYWSDDDDDDDQAEKVPIIQRLMVRGRRRASSLDKASGKEESSRARSRVRVASKGLGAWVGWN